MLNLFAGGQADRLDLQRLVQLHAEGAGLVLRSAGPESGDGRSVAILEDGEASVAATVTEVLRLASVGAYVLSEGAPDRNSSAVSLAHLRHVLRRAEERDRLIVAVLASRAATYPDTPAEAAGGLSDGDPSPPAGAPAPPLPRESPLVTGLADPADRLEILADRLEELPAPDLPEPDAMVAHKVAVTEIADGLSELAEQFRTGSPPA